MTTVPITRFLTAGESASLADAALCLERGGLVAFPTETVYGLGADACNGPAVARLYAAKGRPAFNPLIAHVSDVEAARQLAEFGETAATLAAAFWPGPLTLVLRRRAGCPIAELATAGLDTIALRAPAHPVAQALLAAFGKPVVAPSANISGHVSPTSARHVLTDLSGRIDMVVDGGPTTVGVESTIVACLDRPTLVRPGGVPREAIEALLEQPLAEHRGGQDKPLAPGLLASHYAPRAALRLNALAVAPDEAALAFGPLPAGLDRARAALNLSADGDLAEAAVNLFSHLRALDAAGARTIAVAPVPDRGLGEAINDRLRRAAAPRPVALS